MKSEIPFSGIGAKNIEKTQPFPPTETRKKKKILDLTQRGKFNDIAHGSIIQVSMLEIMMESKPSRCTAK